jgi:hypothetical protein
MYADQVAAYLGRFDAHKTIAPIEMVYVLTQGSSVALPGSISPRRPSRPGRSA